MWMKGQQDIWTDQQETTEKLSDSELHSELNKVKKIIITN